jgi:hypothetical protein
MLYGQRFIYEPKYEQVSSNQNGARFKKTGSRQVGVCKLEAKTDNAKDLHSLICLASELNLVIHWDYSKSPQTAWIEVRPV